MIHRMIIGQFSEKLTRCVCRGLPDRTFYHCYLERFTRNLHKLKNKIVKGTENCKNLREKVSHTKNTSNESLLKNPDISGALF